jgi:hemerythrin-like domain-containing protein
MNFSNRISQTLHEEHLATVALMQRLEQFLARNRDSVPDAGDIGARQLCRELATALETEVRRHFDFEEKRLFTFLDAAGEGAIGAHLKDEHNIIRPLGAKIAQLARAAEAGFDQASWSDFRRVGQELCERLFSHVEKEEMALVPLIEETMDAATEARLVQEYIETV